jgi:acetolactate synthase-1/2/3 large subunit
VQGSPIDAGWLGVLPSAAEQRTAAAARVVDEVRVRVRQSERPVLLLGGGVSRRIAATLRREIESADLAVMTTWNACDRVDSHAPNYFGRPNTWGMRYSNVLLQQADLLISVGTRLGLQQTGFNWRAFAPVAHVVQVDIDAAELEKGHPRVDTAICADADDFLARFLEGGVGGHEAWLDFCRFVKGTLPLAEARNVHGPGFVDPYEFAAQLSAACNSTDIVIPSSSGGSFTTMMQAFAQKSGQTIVSNKGLAAMGYGLATAIGAGLAFPDRRTILTEGDGGFAQNVQDIATVRANDMTLKMFVHSNEGYASIRMTQRNYFGGAYIGCDRATGLGFPNWVDLFRAYSIPCLELDESGLSTPGALEQMEMPGPAAFIVPIDPEQTYFPKISSVVTSSGDMESAPLHLMTPDLEPETLRRVLGTPGFKASTK